MPPFALFRQPLQVAGDDLVRLVEQVAQSFDQEGPGAGRVEVYRVNVEALFAAVVADAFDGGLEFAVSLGDAAYFVFAALDDGSKAVFRRCEAVRLGFRFLFFLNNAFRVFGVCLVQQFQELPLCIGGK